MYYLHTLKYVFNVQITYIYLYLCIMYIIYACTVSVSNPPQVNFNIVIIINVIYNNTVLEIKPLIFQLNLPETPRNNMIQFDRNQFKN